MTTLAPTPLTSDADNSSSPAPEPTSVRFRDSTRLVLARYLGDLPSFALGLTGTVLWVTSWVDPWRSLGIALMVITALSMVFGPWIRLLTVSYTVSPHGIQMDSGVIERRSEYLPWDLITSMDDRASWSLRALGLTEVVCAQTGEDGSRITLQALDSSRLALLRRYTVNADVVSGESHAPELAVADSEAPSSSESVTDPATADDAVLIHRTSLRDLLLMSLIYGQVILLVPPVAFALMEVTDLFGFTDDLESSLVAGLGSAPTVALIVLAVALVGVGATVLKYHGMTVHALADGRLRIRYGLLATHQRTIHPGAVQGVVWQRNVVEQLVGRTRLSLLTLDTSSQLGGNLVLPSLPHALTVRLVEEHLPQYSPSAHLLHAGRATVMPSLLAWVALGLVLGGTWWLTAQVWNWDGVWAAVTVMTMWIVTSRVGGILRTRMVAQPEDRLMAARRLLFSDRVIAIPSTRLHGVTSADISVAGKVSRPLLPTVHYFAGAPRRLRAITVAPDTLAAVRSMVRFDSTPLRG